MEIMSSPPAQTIEPTPMVRPQTASNRMEKVIDILGPASAQERETEPDEEAPPTPRKEFGLPQQIRQDEMVSEAIETFDDDDDDLDKHLQAVEDELYKPQSASHLRPFTASRRTPLHF